MSGEKTEQPTAKRLRKAREDGNVAKSAEFTGVAVMITSLVAAMLWVPRGVDRWFGFVRQATTYIEAPSPDLSSIPAFMQEAWMLIMFSIMPILGAAFVIAAFIAYVQIGPVFAFKALIPDSNKLNPANGFKNMFSKAKAVDLAKNVGKLTLMGAIGVTIYLDQIPDLVRTPELTLSSAMVVFGRTAFDVSQYLLGGLVGFAVLDIIWQRHKHNKDLMMSKQEVKEEYKESEGDPQIKAKRKQMHKELLREASMGNVKTADAVVVNPTHVAAAIRYNEAEADAPRVVAKGRGETAQRIRKLARRYDVPLVRDVSLARALVDVDLEDEIPEDLYEAVAEVLQFVYSLREEES